MVRIYLAHHGIPKRIEEAKKLQTELEFFGFEIVNPFTYNKIAEHLFTQWEVEKDRTDTLAMQIVEFDKANIRSCDAVVAYVREPSVGCCMEILYANDVVGIPVFILTDYESPWLIHHGIICKDKGMLIECLREEFRE